MIVPDEIRKCVAFLGYQIADLSFRMAGSVFFLGEEKEGGGIQQVYAVTAKHVIENIRSQGLTAVWFRMNQKTGEAKWYQSSISNWFSHPTDASVDVSILPIGITAELDHLVIPYSVCITDQRMKDNEVGLGDEVFIIGLFRHHYGNSRNIPVVRVGNIASLTEEKISTQTFGEIDGYLIEARSIGGLSGSPVFVNLGVARLIQGEVRFAKPQPIFYLIGLIHGHYDVSSIYVDETSDEKIDRLTPERVNTGIAIVVPINRIQEVIRNFETRNA